MLQVWYPNSAQKTAHAMEEFDREGLPLVILANCAQAFTLCTLSLWPAAGVVSQQRAEDGARYGGV